jgi:hypothetical protein
MKNNQFMQKHAETNRVCCCSGAIGVQRNLDRASLNKSVRRCSDPNDMPTHNLCWLQDYPVVYAVRILFLILQSSWALEVISWWQPTSLHLHIHSLYLETHFITGDNQHHCTFKSIHHYTFKYISSHRWQPNTGGIIHHCTFESSPVPFLHLFTLQGSWALRSIARWRLLAPFDRWA